jgi:GAF domain-containing protein
MSDLAPASSRQSETVRLALSTLPGSTPIYDVFHEVCRLAATVIQVERIGIWFLENENRMLRCVNLYESSRNMHSSGQTLAVDQIPNYVASLMRRRTLPIERVSDLPWSRELHDGYCKPLGVISMLDSGIFHNGILIGVVCHEQVGSIYDWTTEDRDFSASIADFISSRLPPDWPACLSQVCDQAAKTQSPEQIMAATGQIVQRIARDADSVLQLLQGSDRTTSGHAKMFVYASDIRQAADDCKRFIQYRSE